MTDPVATFLAVETQSMLRTSMLEIPLCMCSFYCLQSLLVVAKGHLSRSGSVPRPLGHWLLFLLLVTVAATLGAVRFLMEALREAPAPSERVVQWTAFFRVAHRCVTEAGRTLGVAGLALGVLAQSVEGDEEGFHRRHSATYTLLRVLLYGGALLSLGITAATLTTSQSFVMVQAPAMGFSLIYLVVGLLRVRKAGLLALLGVVLFSLAGKAPEVLAVDTLPWLSAIDVAHLGMALALPLMAAGTKGFIAQDAEKEQQQQQHKQEGKEEECQDGKRRKRRAAKK